MVRHEAAEALGGIANVVLYFKEYMTREDAPVVVRESCCQVALDMYEVCFLNFLLARHRGLSIPFTDHSTKIQTGSSTPTAHTVCDSARMESDMYTKGSGGGKRKRVADRVPMDHGYMRKATRARWSQSSAYSIPILVSLPNSTHCISKKSF